MRVLKIWDAEYPWDVRAEKVMRSLTSAGHEVHLVARNRRWDAAVEMLPEATVHRLSPYRLLGRRFDATMQFPFFANPRWLSHVFRTGRATRADLILVRDLPLAPTAIWAGRRLGVPVALDMAENYPAMIRDIWTSGRRKPLDVVVRNPRIVEAVERWVLPRLDHVLVVVEESADRLAALGVERSRLTLVCNTPLPERIPNEQSIHREAHPPLRVVYLGLLEKPRGVGTVLQGIALARSAGLECVLDVIGGGRDEGDFRSQAAALGLTSKEVAFHGVLPYETALSIVARAHVGVVPHFAVESWNSTIPNKLFDYMSQGLPVVTSTAIPAARIVREAEAGLVFESEDAGDLARTLKELSDPALRARFAARGREAVRTKYNWSVDERRLLDALTSVVAPARSPIAGRRV